MLLLFSFVYEPHRQPHVVFIMTDFDFWRVNPVMQGVYISLLKTVPTKLQHITIISGSCREYHFCRDKSFVETSIHLSRQETCFVATNTCVHACVHACVPASVCACVRPCVCVCVSAALLRFFFFFFFFFVTARLLLSRQKTCLSRQNFLATKMLLVAAPSSDT